jgi:hypothetical protein
VVFEFVKYSFFFFSEVFSNIVVLMVISWYGTWSQKEGGKSASFSIPKLYFKTSNHFSQLMPLYARLRAFFQVHWFYFAKRFKPINITLNSSPSIKAMAVFPPYSLINGGVQINHNASFCNSRAASPNTD